MMWKEANLYHHQSIGGPMSRSKVWPLHFRATAEPCLFQFELNHALTLCSLAACLNLNADLPLTLEVLAALQQKPAWQQQFHAAAAMPHANVSTNMGAHKSWDQHDYLLLLQPTPVRLQCQPASPASLESSLQQGMILSLTLSLSPVPR